MAITPAVAIVVSAAVGAAGTIAGIALQPKPPKPPAPPDPRLAREEELKKLAQADNTRARAITQQKQYDNQFVKNLREGGLQL